MEKKCTHCGRPLGGVGFTEKVTQFSFSGQFAMSTGPVYRDFTMLMCEACTDLFVAFLDRKPEDDDNSATAVAWRIAQQAQVEKARLLREIETLRKGKHK